MGIALTFTGHGVLALSIKEEWLVYLGVLGFHSATAEWLMRLIGGLDLLVALVVIIKPFRLLVLWAFIWALATALIRPIAGESLLAFVERGANWAAPLALYFILSKDNKDSIDQ